MDYKTDALLLKTVNIGESDKMATLLTADRGKIGARMKGVRKAGAKLGFASQPFCFAEYVLVGRADRYTVTGAALHEGFFDLRSDLRSLYAAAAIVQVCDALALEEMPSGGLLLAAVEALGAIESDPAGTMPEVVRFLLRAAAFAGYPVSAGDCPSCGKKIEGKRFFDPASGSFYCETCAAGAPASRSTYECIRSLSGMGGGYDADGLIRALRLMKMYLTYQNESVFPALGEYLAMMEAERT